MVWDPDGSPDVHFRVEIITDAISNILHVKMSRSSISQIRRSVARST